MMTAAKVREAVQGADAGISALGPTHHPTERRRARDCGRHAASKG